MVSYLILDHLHKKINDKVVLKDINVSIDEATIFSIAGPPGSGKTTLLKIIAGLIAPTSGRIYLEGRDITDLPPNKRGVSAIFEIPPVYPDRNGYENIAFPLRLRKLPEDEIRKKVYEVAELLNITHILKRNPKTYSGGEYQRIALARALVTDPKLLLMDEPFRFLDAKIRESFVAWLKDFQQRLKITIIYSTNDPLEAMSLGSKIMILIRGVQKQIGTLEELIRAPIDLEVDEYITIPAINIMRGRITDSYIEIQGTPMLIEWSREGEQFAKEKLPGEVIIAVRPSDIHVSKTEMPGSYRVVARLVQYYGHNQLVTVELDNITLRCIVSKAMDVKEGETLYIKIPSDRIRIYDPATLKLLR